MFKAHNAETRLAHISPVPNRCVTERRKMKLLSNDIGQTTGGMIRYGDVSPLLFMNFARNVPRMKVYKRQGCDI